MFKDLSFKINRGESIALLGRNGAGKSTLLRLLGGIDLPDRGTIRRSGSISWPVGLTGGFQGSLTARENLTFVCKIYASGNDIQEKIMYVEKFAEIGEYFDRPFKTYSSGMRSRVAFGLSMAFDFDVYLIDEVTSAGDERFRAKSREVLQERHKNADFIMVDHNLLGLKFHCNRAFLLHQGKLIEFDSLNEGIEMHKSLLLNPSEATSDRNAKKTAQPSAVATQNLHKGSTPRVAPTSGPSQRVSKAQVSQPKANQSKGDKK